MRSQRSQLPFAGAALAVFLSSAIGLAAQSTPGRTLLALSKRNHTLAIVDPNTLQVIARAPIGPDPHEVIASSDGKTAYVSIYGGGRYHALSVIDLVGQKALTEIDTGAVNGPHGLAFVGGKVWFTVIPVGKGDEGFDVSPDGRELWTANALDGTLSVVDLTTRTVTAASDSMAAKPEALP